MRVGGEGWCGRAHAARTVPLACAYRLVYCLGRMAGPCPVQYDGSVAERLRSRVPTAEHESSRRGAERSTRLTVDEYGGQEQAQFALSDWPWARRVS